MPKKVFRYPDNWKPNRVILKESEGRTDVHATSKGDPTHSHSVIENGEHVYSRTQGGNVVHDVPRGGKICPKCGQPM